ncbi:uncharacterized protein [Oryza sativa Japonica Group]|uniref:uncharacterized protein n=1 Tax=Oryza sativa subsp. japonica TaxID=39947 RepID=UPI00339D1A88
MRWAATRRHGVTATMGRRDAARRGLAARQRQRHGSRRRWNAHAATGWRRRRRGSGDEGDGTWRLATMATARGGLGREAATRGGSGREAATRGDGGDRERGKKGGAVLGDPVEHLRVLHKPEPKGRGRGGKVQASLLAPRKLDLGKGKEETKGKEVKKKYVAPQEFQLGMPLVGDDVLATLGTACKDLHLYYMEKSNARKPSKATDILGQHNGKPFLGPTNYIVVDFKDLFDLYRLRAVDTSLLKCYSLLSWQWCQKHAPEVAFLDPQVVTVTNLQNDCQGMVNYIYDTLWSRRDKEYIMCDYNQYAHWILLVITPK